MLKRKFLFLAALALSVNLWTGTARAQIPTIDNQWLTDFIAQIEEAKSQFDMMKDQADRMAKMAQAICEDPVGFGKGYLQSQGIPCNKESYIPNYPAGLEQLQNEIENPEQMQNAAMDTFGLNQTEGENHTVASLSSEARNEIRKKRTEMIIACAEDAYKLSLNIQQEEASIGDRIEVLSEGAGDSPDARGDIGVNTGFVVEMVYKANQLNALLSTELKLESALGFMEVPIH